MAEYIEKAEIILSIIGAFITLYGIMYVAARGWYAGKSDAPRKNVVIDLYNK